MKILNIPDLSQIWLTTPACRRSVLIEHDNGNYEPAKRYFLSFPRMLWQIAYAGGQGPLSRLRRYTDTCTNIFAVSNNKKTFRLGQLPELPNMMTEFQICMGASKSNSKIVNFCKKHVSRFWDSKFQTDGEDYDRMNCIKRWNKKTLANLKYIPQLRESFQADYDWIERFILDSDDDYENLEVERITDSGPIVKKKHNFNYDQQKIEKLMLKDFKWLLE